MKNTLETKLGIFVALTVIAAAVLLEMTGGGGLFTRNYRAHALFKTAQELKPGAPVKMAGVQIGRVEKVELTDDKVDIVMKIEDKYAIRTDSKALIKFAGLMGENFVAINIGSSKTSFEKSAYPLIESAEQPDLSAIMSKLDNVASGVENLTKSFSGDQLQNILGPFTDFLNQNRANLALMIGNMKSVSQGLVEGKGTVGKMLTDDSLYTNALSAVNNLNSTADDVKKLMGDTQGLLGDAKSAIGEAKLALTEARTVVADIQAGKGSMGKLLKDETLFNETTTAMTNLKEILQKINQGQGSVGKLVNDDSFFKNAKMTLQKVEKATEGLEDQGPLSVLGTAVNSLF